MSPNPVKLLDVRVILKQGLGLVTTVLVQVPPKVKVDVGIPDPE